MKTMNFPFSKTVLATALALAMTGCFHEDDASKNVQPAENQDNTKNYILAVDGEGYVNIYKDDGSSTTTVGSFKVNAAGGITLGEMHFHHGRAFIVIQGGLKDANDADIGGGIAIVDMNAALANPNGDASTFLKIVPLTATKVTGPSRIVHTYMDPDGEHLWLNNDGLRGNNDADSVFVINWHHPDATTLAAYADEIKTGVQEIVVGNGHKKSAFSHASTTLPNTPPTFATHNLSDQTVSIIDNNPANTATFRSVLTTVDLKTTAQIYDPTLNGGAGGNRNKSNTPHGLDFSISSGRFYTGITPGEDMGLAIIDPANGNALTSIPAGMDAANGQIPAAGYVHASHDGEYVYTVGYKNNRGYLSIIMTMAGMPDTVHQVIDLGDFKSSSLDISHMEHVEQGMTEHHVKILVPSGFRNENSLRSKIAVIEIDHDTGKLKGCDTVTCDASKIGYIDAGATRGEHRNGEVSADGTRAVYPNNDCKLATLPSGASEATSAILMAEDGADCKTINVIDVMTGAVSKIATAGRGPGSIGILSKASLTDADPTNGDGHGEHQH